MTMRFGTPQCIRCSMVGHLSHQCNRPILPVVLPEPTIEEQVEVVHDIYADYLYDSLC